MAVLGGVSWCQLEKDEKILVKKNSHTLDFTRKISKILTENDKKNLRDNQ